MKTTDDVLTAVYFQQDAALPKNCLFSLFSPQYCLKTTNYEQGFLFVWSFSDKQVSLIVAVETWVKGANFLGLRKVGFYFCEIV